jgi:adenine/guanine phosphoribosyltransferase-like PRPP-binding protein
MTKKTKHDYECSHTEKVFELRWVKRLIPRAAKLLKGVEFDAIAFRGMSGCLFAAPLALRLGKSLLMVRKPNQSHTYRIVEGDKLARTYIIVDDFISTGETMREIVKALSDWADRGNRELRCVGVMTARSVHKTYKSDRQTTWPKPYKLASIGKALKGDDKP